MSYYIFCLRLTYLKMYDEFSSMCENFICSLWDPHLCGIITRYSLILFEDGFLIQILVCLGCYRLLLKKNKNSV